MACGEAVLLIERKSGELSMQHSSLGLQSLPSHTRCTSARGVSQFSEQEVPCAGEDRRFLAAKLCIQPAEHVQRKEDDVMLYLH